MAAQIEYILRVPLLRRAPPSGVRWTAARQRAENRLLHPALRRLLEERFVRVRWLGPPRFNLEEFHVELEAGQAAGLVSGGLDELAQAIEQLSGQPARFALEVYVNPRS